MYYSFVSFEIFQCCEKTHFLDFSGVFWWKLNCSNLFPESNLLKKNFDTLKNFDTWKNVDTWKNFVFKNWKALIFFHYLGKIAGLRPAIFSGTSRNSKNQILSIIDSKKWPESPQKHQILPKNMLLK